MTKYSIVIFNVTGQDATCPANARVSRMKHYTDPQLLNIGIGKDTASQRAGNSLSRLSVGTLGGTTGT